MEEPNYLDSILVSPTAPARPASPNYADNIRVSKGNVLEETPPSVPTSSEFNYILTTTTPSLTSTNDVFVFDVSSTEWFKDRVVAPAAAPHYYPDPATNPNNYDPVHDRVHRDKKKAPQTKMAPQARLQQSAPDWSNEFLNLVSEPESDHKYQSLAHLASNFLHIAKTYGKIIIQEYHLPADKKVSLWGEKYITHNIIFKFAVDWKGYYGGDEYAMKAAGHELKGLMSVFQCQIPSLNVPLMCLLDYRGYRLSASSMLPINPPQTLVYGSEDGGMTVASQDPGAAAIMETLGKKLNLARHQAARSGQQVYGPTDIEVHRVRDQYFMLDFARLFPPEPPVRNGASLYNLLRPELVRKSPEPLSSDAFTMFGVEDKEKSEKNIRALLSDLPARCSAFASSLQEANRQPRDNIELVTRLHRHGLNIRYLGPVRHCLSTSSLREMVLVEMIARIIKAHLQQKMRDLMKVLQFSLKANFIADTVAYLNVLLGEPSAPQTQAFWGTVMKGAILQKWGPDSLSPLEQAGSIRPQNIAALFRRLHHVSGLRISNSAYQELAGLDFLHEGFELVGSDIDKLAEKTKHMNLIEYAEGTALVLQSKKARSVTQQTRLFTLGLKKYEAAVLSKPDDFLTLNAWAQATWQLYNKHWQANRGHPPAMHPYNNLFETAGDKWALAQNQEAILVAATDVADWADSEGAARYCYERVMTALSQSDSAFGPSYEAQALRVRVQDSLVSWIKSVKKRQFDCQKTGAHYRRLVLDYPKMASAELHRLASDSNLTDGDLGALYRIVQRQGTAPTEDLHSVDCAWLLPDSLDGRLPTALATCSGLTSLRFKGSSIGDAVLTNFISAKGAPSLTNLNLVGTKVTNAGVRAACLAWPTLCDLRLTCPLTEETAQNLLRLTSLSSLRLDLTGLTGSFLLQLPLTMTSLRLYNCQQVKADHWPALGRLNKLRSLHLAWAQELRPKVLLKFCASFPHLHSLKLPYLQLPLSHIEKLLNSCRLRLLEVTGNIFCPPDALERLGRTHPTVRLIQAQANEELSLPVLRVPSNSTKEQVVRLTSQLSSSTTVTDVIVQNARDFQQNFETLLVGLSTTRCSSLRKLSISHSSLNSDQGRRLADVLASNRSFQLDTLELSHCDLGAEAATDIANVFSGRYLSLAGVSLDQQACASLGRLLAARQLTDLCLASCSIGDSGVNQLVLSLQDNPDNRSLNLDLSRCEIGVQGAVHLGFCLGNDPYIKTLTLQHNRLGDDGMKALAAGLQYNDWLTCLNVSDNNITNTGMQQLVKGMRENWKLEVLILDNNQISDEGLGCLFAFLNANSRLRHLSVQSQTVPLRAPFFQYLAGFVAKRKEVWKLQNSHFTIDLTLQAPPPELCEVVIQTYCEVFRAGAELHIQPQAVGDRLRHQATAMYEKFLASRRTEERHGAYDLSLTQDPGLSAGLRRHLEVKKKDDKVKEEEQAKVLLLQEAKRREEVAKAQAEELAVLEAAALKPLKTWKKNVAQIIKAQSIIRGYLVRKNRQPLNSNT